LAWFSVISSDPKKVQMIRDAVPPTSKEICNSFVCMCAWNDCFIHRYAGIVRPLRDPPIGGVGGVWASPNALAGAGVKFKGFGRQKIFNGSGVELKWFGGGKARTRAG
jgi:hypothetical protein